MKKVKTIILRTGGTNCDLETAHAFKKAGSEVELVHINRLISEKSMLSKFHIMAVPGGFTYGDDVASGKILANEIKFNLRNDLLKFVKQGKPIIGICNGFQVLVKMGLLPDISGKKDFTVEATLSLNDSGKFDDRWVYLKGDGDRPDTGKSTNCIWTKDLPDVIYLPIAHAEGKFIPKNASVLRRLHDNGQVVFRYSDEEGSSAPYPLNPNGSIDDIAGICDPTGAILGLMPHPERHVTYLQHPNWRRALKNDKRMGVGLKIFKNGVKFARANI